MNKERREELLEVTELLDEAIDRIGEIRDEEEDALYSLPDGLQESSRGFAMQDAMDTLDGFVDSIGEIRSKIEEFASPKKKDKTEKAMRRFQFSDDEYNKLSAVTGFPAVDLQKLDALGLLANDTAVRMVLEYEYNLQRKTTKALPTLILQAIANKYGLTPQKVRGFLFHRKQPVYYCSKCHKEISKGEHKRYNGLCEKCVVDSIKL